MDFERLQNVIPKDPIKWSTEDVGEWLKFIGLSQYNQAFKLATIDGACLSHITDEDLQSDLGITSNIIRKKIMNWLQIGIKEYSVFLKGGNKSQQQEQITYSDIPFNVFQKQSLENDYYRNNNNTQQNWQFEKTNISKGASISENNEPIFDMMTGNMKLNSSLSKIDIEENNNNINLGFNNNSNNILTENNSVMNQNPSILNQQKQQQQLYKNQLQQKQQQNTDFPIPLQKNVFSRQDSKNNCHTPYNNDLHVYNNNNNNNNNVNQQQQFQQKFENVAEQAIQQRNNNNNEEETKSNISYNNNINNNNNNQVDQNNNINNNNQFNNNENKIECEENTEITVQQKNKIVEQQINNNNQNQNQYAQLQRDIVTQNKLIIQPSDGPQTNFYCIDETGGKIGRHSTNQILILEESISRFHAEILFEDNQFGIKDIGSTTGSFIKIQEQLKLSEGMVLEMGSNQFLVQETEITEENIGILHLVIIEGTNVNEKYDLKFESKKQRYNLGRKLNNEIKMPDDQHLSNQHCRFYFMDNTFYLEDMSSTNGSWRRISAEGQISDFIPLFDKSVFKIGTTSTYVCKISTEQIAEIASDNVCVICCENDRDALYLPCKHNTACVKCSKNLKECPICRIKIEDFIKIYKA